MAEVPSKTPVRGGANKVERVDESAKFEAGNCETLRMASLKCIEDFGYDRAAAATGCKTHYDAYRECRRLQNEERTKANGEYMKNFWGGLFGR